MTSQVCMMVTLFTNTGMDAKSLCVCTFLHNLCFFGLTEHSTSLVQQQVLCPARGCLAVASVWVQLSLGFSLPSTMGTTVCDRGTLITGLGNKARRDGHVGPGGQVSGGRKGCLGKSHSALWYTLIHLQIVTLAGLGAHPSHIILKASTLNVWKC